MDADQCFRYGTGYFYVIIVLGLIVPRIMPIIVNKSIRVVRLISVATIIMITAVIAGNVEI